MRENYELGNREIPSPPELPEYSEWVLDIFYALRGFCKEWSDPISPGLMIDWAKVSGDYIIPQVAVIIAMMDRVYRSEISELTQKIDELRRS